MKKLTATAAMAAALISGVAHADILGFGWGRSADVTNYEKMSVEAAVRLGSASIIGGRGTFKASDELAVYADAGIALIEDLDAGLSFGGGAIYQLPNLFKGSKNENNLKAAIKANLHYAIASDDRSATYFDGFRTRRVGVEVDYSFLTLGAAGVISGDIPNAEERVGIPLSWYGTAGLEYLNESADVDDCSNCGGSDSYFGLSSSVGFFSTIGPGQASLGLEYNSIGFPGGVALTAGYRMSF